MKRKTLTFYRFTELLPQPNKQIICMNGKGEYVAGWTWTDSHRENALSLDMYKNKDRPVYLPGEFTWWAYTN